MKTNKNLHNIFIWLHHVICKYDKHLYLFILLSAISNSASIIAVALIPKFILSIIQQEQKFTSIMITLSVYGVVLLVSGFLNNYTKEYSEAKYMKIRLSIIEENGEMFMKLPYSTIESSDFMDLCQKGHAALRGSDQGFHAVLTNISLFFGHVLTCIISFLYVSSYASYLLGLIVIIVLINRFIQYKQKSREKAIRDEMVSKNRQADYYYEVMSDFSYGKEVRMYSFADWVERKLNTALQGIRSKKRIIYRNDLISGLILKGLVFIQEIIVYLVFIIATLAGKIDIGSFLSYIGLITSFSVAFISLLEDSVQIRYHSMFVQDLIEYRKELVTLIQGNEKIECQLDKSDWKIEFENVSFRYPNRNEYALKNVSFTVEKGQKIALIGLNGAGKTTIIKLMTRLYDVDEGRILFNHVDIRNICREQYYRLFAPMFQEVFLFAFSVSENIAMNYKDLVDQEKVMLYLSDVKMVDQVKTLKNGLYTSCLKILDNEGCQFSGGEEQRFLLARTLYKDSDIFIFDEPTAALDPIIEDQIYQEFNRFTYGKTTFYITHRLASTRFCDRIFVFSQGRLVEEGTHDELMALNGDYCSLYELQSKHYSVKC